MAVVGLRRKKTEISFDLFSQLNISEGNVMNSGRLATATAKPKEPTFTCSNYYYERNRWSASKSNNHHKRDNVPSRNAGGACRQGLYYRREVWQDYLDDFRRKRQRLRSAQPPVL